MIKSIKSGFTLAEVLTTLMVIGVVAAMTIPTLLNSTQDQQARVAAKKAASVLSQGIQLMKAKEIECTITNAAPSDTLAACMSQVLAGSLNADTITTQDGMVYKFYAPPITSDTDFESACGSNFGGWTGAGNCAVAVDTNGVAKGFKNFLRNSGDFTTAGFAATPGQGTDQIGFSLSAAGARPIAFSADNDKTYSYIYGKAPAAADIANPTLCVRDGAEVTDCKDNETQVKVDGEYYYTQSNSCSNGYESHAGRTLVNNSCATE